MDQEILPAVLRPALPINPYAALFQDFNAGTSTYSQQVPLLTYNVGPSYRDGGPLQKTHMGLVIVEDGLTDVGGFRPYRLPPRAKPFSMPKDGSFVLPVTFEIVSPDALMATDLVTGYSDLYFSVSSGDCILRHVEGTVEINPSKTTYTQVMHQIIAAASNLTGLLSLTSHRQDWLWVMLLQSPLFLEKVSARDWDTVWPLLGHQTSKLMTYLIEVCPEGKDTWETWQRNVQFQPLPHMIEQVFDESM